MSRMTAVEAQEPMSATILLNSIVTFALVSHLTASVDALNKITSFDTTLSWHTLSLHVTDDPPFRTLDGRPRSVP
jgi:hypothetical protein